MGGKRRERSQKGYRATLDRLFDSGKIGELIEKQSPGSAPTADDESRIKLLRAIRDAEGRPKITAAVDAYLKKYELPTDDVEVLAKLLEHRNPTRQIEAMEALLVATESEKPRRTRTIVAQAKMIRDTNDEKEMIDLANQLIERLD